MQKLCVLLTVILISCKSFESKKNVQAVTITQTYPILSAQGIILNYDTTSVSIVPYENYTVYELEYGFDSTVNSKLITSENRHHYIVHEKDSIYGYDYDTHKIPHKRRVLMDSVYKIEWFSQTNLYRILFTHNIATLLSSTNDANTGVLTETYSLKGKTDSLMSGTCVLKYSDNLRIKGFSLSKELDSLKYMKLYEAKITGNPYQIQGSNIFLDRMEISYKITPTIKNISEIEGYILSVN